MRKILFVLFPILLSFLAFRGLFLTYFQQDEWHAFGAILANGMGYVTLQQSWMRLLFSGDRVGARFLIYLLFSKFGLNATPYFILSLGLHAVNAWLVYILAKKILKDRLIAYVSGVIFLFSGVASQSYTWLGTFSGSVPNMTFMLLSIFFYLKYLLQEERPLFLLESLIMLWISFLFKETGFFLFIFYPAIYFIFKRNILKTIKVHLPFFIYALLIFYLRINEVIAPVGTSANLETGSNSFGTIFLNAILYPLQGFSQLIFPPNVIYGVSSFFSSVIFKIAPYTTESDIFSQTQVAPFISLLITIILLLFLYKIIRSKTNQSFVFPIYFSSLFVFLSFVPYFIIKKTDAFLEPRYYYNGLFASSILISILLVVLLRKKRAIFYVSAIAAFIGILFFNISSIKDEIQFQVDAAIDRKYILSEILKTVPHLPKKVIFYVDGNSIGYYGLPDLKVPFQSGLGQTLLVIYAEKKEISPKFLQESSIAKTEGEGFLYGILDQNYKEIDGRGFGYFWDKSELLKQAKKTQDVKNSVYAFFYDSENHKLSNTSDKIRNGLFK